MKKYISYCMVVIGVMMFTIIIDTSLEIPKWPCIVAENLIVWGLLIKYYVV